MKNEFLNGINNNLCMFLYEVISLVWYQLLYLAAVHTRSLQKQQHKKHLAPFRAKQ